MDTLLDVRRLAKHFGPIVAVDDVSFNVQRGEVLGFLGPNGAGKSTTMKMITGFLAPSLGTALVAGFDVIDQPTKVKARLGYLPEGAPLYADMTPAELIAFTADARGLDGRQRRIRRDWVVQRMGLERVLHQAVDTLSKGYKRRVGLALAVLHDPEVLILDEPTDGLDPNQKHEVRSLINEMASSKAIVISTHLLDEVETICTRAVLIARGRVVADATPEALIARAPQHNAIVLTVPVSTADRVASALTGLPLVVEAAALPEGEGLARVTAVPAGGASIADDVLRAVQALGVEPLSFTVERGRLEDVFRALTTTAQPTLRQAA